MKIQQPINSLARLLSIISLGIGRVASAQVDREVEELVRKGVTWVQGVAIGLCVIAVIRAGLAFTDEARAENAWHRLKLTLTGCVIIFGAVGIVQFVKSQFSAQTF